MIACPKCSSPADLVDATTASTRDAPVVLQLRCSCGIHWTASDVSLPDAIEILRGATSRHPWVGTLHAQLGLLLEMSGLGDKSYEQHAIALRCKDDFDRAFCHERRAAYEVRRGWLRNALTSFRAARAANQDPARELTYREAIAYVEKQLIERGVAIPPHGRETHDKRWLRECELERPVGFGDKNELGEPLTDDILEVERLLRSAQWDDAIAQLRRLRAADAAKLVDAIGYASHGVSLARRAGRLDAAIALQELVVEAYVIYASWSTSGGEGLARTADADRERALLRELRTHS